MAEAFGMADKVLYEAVRGVSDLINYQGCVNVDFADIRTIMANKGMALMGVGVGNGDHRTVEAAQRAISSPLLDDVTIAGATSVLINVTGSSDLTMFEITEASTMIQEEAHEDANVIWGWVVDETMGDEARVTVIATGFDESFLAATPSVERRVAEAMRGGRLVANGGNNGGYRGPAGGSGMVSGLNPDDYDIPTFYKNAD
jgi:cell division protein FtsZ